MEVSGELSEAGLHHDRRGVPIYPGDLLKTDHFVDRRGKRYYLYHVVVERKDEGGCLEMVPASHLEPRFRNQGGRCWLKTVDLRQSKVIHGSGPGDCLDFDDRPKVKATTRAEA